jgi:hypothetical protein
VYLGWLLSRVLWLVILGVSSPLVGASFGGPLLGASVGQDFLGGPLLGASVGQVFFGGPLLGASVGQVSISSSEVSGIHRDHSLSDIPRPASTGSGYSILIVTSGGLLGIVLP